MLLRFSSYALIAILALPLAALDTKRDPAADPKHPDYIVPVVRNLPPTEGSKTLTVLSWNVKHLGRKGFDTIQAAPLLKGADVITLQEVNTSASGLEALNAMAAELEKLTKTKICKALSERPSDGTERYGYLWRDDRVAFVKSNGDIMDHCPATALTMRLGVRNAAKILREPAFGILYFRPEARAFLLASIHLRPSGKRPQDEVEPLFETLSHVLIPTIVAGDFNLDSTHASFSSARERRFLAAMSGVKTSLKMKKRELSKPYDNFWYRGFKLQSTKVINLHTEFPRLDPKTIYKGLSDHCPIEGRFEFFRMGGNK
jgi:endonuclease/exonuclease/phosphatase (EEP) superfamily protein YafD